MPQEPSVVYSTPETTSNTVKTVHFSATSFGAGPLLCVPLGRGTTSSGRWDSVPALPPPVQLPTAAAPVHPKTAVYGFRRSEPLLPRVLRPRWSDAELVTLLSHPCRNSSSPPRSRWRRATAADRPTESPVRARGGTSAFVRARSIMDEEPLAALPAGDPDFPVGILVRFDDDATRRDDCSRCPSATGAIHPSSHWVSRHASNYLGNSMGVLVIIIRVRSERGY